MKLLFIRHGEPNYELDCLTEKGKLQAEKLGLRLADGPLTAAYVSPMGRAKETANIALAGRDIEPVVCPWLHEFDVRTWNEYMGRETELWDISPKIWTADKRNYDKELFQTADGMPEEAFTRYDAVRKGLDSLLAGYGLVREGGYFKRTKPADDCTLAFFCHFGATCVSAAYLLGISPMLALQSFSAEPTAIATLCTDDRFGVDVNFRLHGFGDIAHLRGDRK